MIFISHRGNINGKNELEENKPEYIIESINLGYDCEIDLWVENNNLFLGHDLPQHEISFSFLKKYAGSLWVHCKNIEAVTYLQGRTENIIHFFWHQKDDLTLTSRNIIWAYPGNQPIIKSIAVMPEMYNEKNLENCFGVCSDEIERYKKSYGNI